MPACKVCGHWFVKIKPQEELCDKCESALYRLSGYGAPVRHGRWVEKEKYTFGIMYDCSLCENRILDNGHSWNYCPNCGAKMESEGE